MEHTTQFLQGMFAAYMGCEITTKYDEDGKPYKTVGVSFDEGNLQVQMPDGGTDWWNIPICKLILTPLSEIADEDAIELAKIDDKNCDYKFGNNRGFAPDEYRVIFNGTASFVERYYKGRYITGVSIPMTPSLLTIEQIDYLRPKKYDCGYLHISSLIQAGLAVKATK
jgi:hypothetical protein